MTTCSICEHPRRRLIDGRLAMNDSVQRLAVLYELDHRALDAHKRNHITELAPVLLSRPNDTLADMEAMEAEVWQCLELVKQDKEKAHAKDIAMLIGELRQLKLAQLKIKQELRLTAQGEMPAEWEAIRDKILDSLAAHPLALEAVLKALE